MTEEQPNFQRRVPELDGLRGIAILLVIACHYIIAGSAQVTSNTVSSYLLVLNRLTWSGVDLFFVLSGFLIGGILLDVRTSPNYFKTFYMRRFYRILPIYVVTCLLSYLGMSLTAGSADLILKQLFENPTPWYTTVTFTQNIWRAHYGVSGRGFLGITWSLAIEEQFYLTLPFIIRYVKQTRLPYILSLIILFVPVFRLLLYYTHPNWAVATYVLMPARADGLLLGVLAALCVRNPVGWAFLTRHKQLLYAALGILSVGIGVFTLKNWNIGSVPMTSFGYTWIAFFYLCILLIVITQPKCFLSYITRNRLLTEIGILAYGTYLFHLPIQVLSFRLILGHEPRFVGLPSIAVSLLSLILTLVIAKASWIYFEKQLVKQGHRYSYEEKSVLAYNPKMKYKSP